MDPSREELIGVIVGTGLGSRGLSGLDLAAVLA